MPLSQAVAEAHRNGLTEPHPATDLSGADVARKLVIVLRAAGVTLEPSDVQLEPLVPAAALAAPDAAALFAQLTAYDAAFAERVAAAQARASDLCTRQLGTAGSRVRACSRWTRAMRWHSRARVRTWFGCAPPCTTACR